ncbi:MAG: hypothetical protein IJK89_11670 [Clostridia bacterium]|nr:hypothetical protein [Clostridia bacterium]
MKKKNTKKTEQPKPASRMTRREARIAARLSEEQRETREVFRSRMKNAPARMRLKTVRTRGYYRFAREYPSSVNADGFRENRQPSQKLGAKGKWLAVLLCVIAFCAAFIGTRAAMLISAQPGDTDYLATPTDAADQPGIAAMRFTAEDLGTYGAGDIKRMLEAFGCNTALFELKDADGYITFPTELAKGSADEGFVEGAWETVAALEEMDIRTAAYISCFRDSAACAYDWAWAVRDFDDPDLPLYDGDESMWLDPYRQEVVAYITGLMQEALDGGFSYVVLDNVSFPYDLGLRTAYFEAGNVADKGENSILLDFLAEALDITGTNQLILLCDVNGITSDALERENRYGGSLLTCGAENFAVDVRLSFQPEHEPDSQEIGAFKNEVPTAFILSACTAANNAAKASEYVNNPRVLACVERGDNDAALRELLAHTGLNDFIIW